MKRYFRIVKMVLSIANKKPFVVLQMFISCAVYNLIGLLPPIATSGIIAVITDHNFEGIWYYVVLYCIIYVLYYSFLTWNHWTYSVLGEYYHMEVQKKLFKHIADNDEIFADISKGRIVDTCSEDIRYLVDVLDTASESLCKLVMLIVTFGIFFYNNVTIAFIAVGIDLLYIVIANDNAKKVSKYYEGTRKYEDKILDTLNQMLSNITQIKSLNMMPSIDKKIDKTRARWSEDYKRKRKYMMIKSTATPYIVYAGKILLYIYMGYLVTQNLMTIDKLVMLISYFELTINYTDKMLEYMLNLGNYGIRVKRVKNILDYTPDSQIDFGDISNDYIDGRVEFNKVTYVANGKTILNKVSFEAKPNEITAIVGHSGAGKTTIIRLLYRLGRVKSGSILIDDESIYNYTKKVYASNVSGVFQKPFVFEMSIKDNLGLIDPDSKHQIEACKRVGIHSFIESLPKGYNTIVSSNNRVLSDGHKQLLSIARALLTKSEILLFDEVTSNIDPLMTTKIAEVLEDLKQDHTIILITHKPEIMEIADKIVVLDRGRVSAKGPNKQVLAKNPLYRELKNRTFASASKDPI